MLNWSRKKIMRLMREMFFKHDVALDYVGSDKLEDKRIYFKSISITNNTPTNDSVNTGDFIEVIFRKRKQWLLFKCPCGCQYIITLPLQKTHNPYWTVFESEMGRPTVYPSIWQNKGCYSHFWIYDGEIHWCMNTGTEPRFYYPLENS